jgi:hypothetical protein
MPLPGGEQGDGVSGSLGPDPDPFLLRAKNPTTQRPKEPFRRLVDPRELSCGQCGEVCRYDSASGERPDSPEFLKPAPDVWLYFAIDPVSDTLVVSAACSEACMNLLRS